jgi:hypothetical protein
MEVSAVTVAVVTPLVAMEVTRTLRRPVLLVNKPQSLQLPWAELGAVEIQSLVVTLPIMAAPQRCRVAVLVQQFLAVRRAAAQSA